MALSCYEHIREEVTKVEAEIENIISRILKIDARIHNHENELWKINKEMHQAVMVAKLKIQRIAERVNRREELIQKMASLMKMVAKGMAEEIVETDIKLCRMRIEMQSEADRLDTEAKAMSVEFQAKSSEQHIFDRRRVPDDDDGLMKKENYAEDSPSSSGVHSDIQDLDATISLEINRALEWAKNNNKSQDIDEMLTRNEMPDDNGVEHTLYVPPSTGVEDKLSRWSSFTINDEDKFSGVTSAQTFLQLKLAIINEELKKIEEGMVKADAYIYQVTSLIIQEMQRMKNTGKRERAVNIRDVREELQKLMEEWQSVKTETKEILAAADEDINHVKTVVQEELRNVGKDITHVDLKIREEIMWTEIDTRLAINNMFQEMKKIHQDIHRTNEETKKVEEQLSSIVSDMKKNYNELSKSKKKLEECTPNKM